MNLPTPLRGAHILVFVLSFILLAGGLVSGILLLQGLFQLWQEFDALQNSTFISVLAFLLFLCGLCLFTAFRSWNHLDQPPFELISIALGILVALPLGGLSLGLGSL